MAHFRPCEEGLLLYCQVQPRSSRDGVVGLHDDRLKIRITAPPVDGRANNHLAIFVAKILSVARSRVSVISGETGRRKTCLIRGLKALPPNLVPPNG